MSIGIEEILSGDVINMSHFESPVEVARKTLFDHDWPHATIVFWYDIVNGEIVDKKESHDHQLYSLALTKSYDYGIKPHKNRCDRGSSLLYRLNRNFKRSDVLSIVKRYVTEMEGKSFVNLNSLKQAFGKETENYGGYCYTVLAKYINEISTEILDRGPVYINPYIVTPKSFSDSVNNGSLSLIFEKDSYIVEGLPIGRCYTGHERSLTRGLAAGCFPFYTPVILILLFVWLTMKIVH